MNRGFASDNNAGVHPDILHSISEVNKGHCIAYGEDPWTEQAAEMFKALLGNDVEVYFVFNGTSANVLGISAFVKSYHAVICAETAHIYVDECGAPEKYTGCKLLPVQTPDGKLTIDQIKRQLNGVGFEHHVQPKIISVTQPTEMGTLYTVEELKNICGFAHENGLSVHMDGARISNAVAGLNCNIKEITRDAGIDVLSFGGTKNGMMYGEAIIFFNCQMAEDFKYHRKQAMQLASKMRFISAQFLAFLKNDLWLKNARHANRMAQILRHETESIPGVTLTQKTEANGVFAIIPSEVISELQKEFFFYVWDESKSEVRWMTSYDTREEDIYRFTDLLKEMLIKYGR